MRRAIGLAVLVFLAGSAQAATRAVEPQDVFRMHWAGDPQIRKDGTRIVYVRNHNDIMTDDVMQSLWLVDTSTGAQSPLTENPGHYSSPRWSPDGSKIAYVSTGADGKGQIVVRWMHGEAATLTQLTESPGELAWSPDGTRIAFIMLTPTPGPTIGKPAAMPAGAQWAPGPVVINDLNFRTDGSGLDPHGYRHLYVVSANGGGSPRQLTSGPYSEAGPLAWSADGRAIYLAGNRQDDWVREPKDWARHTSMTLGIYRVDVADGSLIRLSHEVGPYHTPRVSPDGSRLAYLGFQDRHLGNQDRRLNVMGTDGRNATVVGESLDRSISDCAWAPDGRSVYVQYSDHGLSRIGKMSLNGHLEIVASNLADVIGPDQLPYTDGEFTVSGNGVIAYSGGGPGQLPEVYVFKDGQSRRLTHLNDELFSDVSVGTLSALPVQSSFDGRGIDAWEVLPPNFDPARKYPLILEIHGGPYASYGPVYSVDYQLYAAAGYIVVYGNPRGSTSGGEDFANTIHNDYPSHDYDDLMSIVDAAIRRGGVDVDNLFVTGSSGGGVLTTWIVGKTHRFRAAVTQRPVVNWTSWLLTTDMGAFGARYWFKNLPWDDPDAYWKHSPISLLGSVTTPTMVIVGQSDLRTTVAEAEQYYQALQLKGVPTTLYEIPGASHGLMKPSQFAQQTSAIIEWFDRHRAPGTPVAAAAPRPLSQLPGVTTIEVPAGPGWLGVGFGSVWLSKSESHLLLRIDPATNAVVARIPVGPDPELGIGVGLGSVWIADTKERSLRRVDPATNRVVSTFPVNLSAEPEGSIGVGAGSVWLLTNDNGTDSGTLSRLDPATGKIIAAISVKPRSYAAVVVGDSVWVSNSADASVQRVDVHTNRVVADIAVHPSPRFLAGTDSGIWVLSQGDGALTRIDPATNRETASVAVGFPGPGGDLSIDDGMVWASAEGAPISMIDPTSNTLVKQFAGGRKMDTLRAAFGAVWVVEESTGKVWKVSIQDLKDLR